MGPDRLADQETVQFLERFRLYNMKSFLDYFDLYNSNCFQTMLKICALYNLERFELYNMN
jgi:hypothetical protein